MKFNDFLQYVEQGKAVTSLTAFRDNLSLEENRRRNEILAHSIWSAGWGFNKIIGHYFPCERCDFETDKDDTYEAYEQTKIIEESFLIVNNDIINNTRDEGRLKKFALRMCTYYEQESLFYRTKDGQNLIIKKDGEEDNKILLSVDKLGDIYSKMKGQIYTFDAIEEYVDLMRGFGGAVIRDKYDKRLAKSEEEFLEEYDDVYQSSRREDKK